MGAQQPSVRQIGKYIVLDVIGAGGMGIVYRAQDPTIGRTVAIKMLRSRDGDGSSGVFDRFFLREMKSTGNLHHKNIVTVYDTGEHEGNPYLVMEYLEGEPVSKIIQEHRPIPLLDKLDLIVQVCDGLQYAHDRNIIHRDIKPANVMLLADGTAKLVDFGVARVAGSDTSLVQTGHIVGSLSYISPEQINSLPIDGRSDIFSTGVMLYEVLTYEVPFKGSDPSSTFVRILREEPIPLSRFIPDAPPALQAVVSRALAKNVQDRYQSAEEFGFDLLGVQQDLKSTAVADGLKRAESAMQRGDLERVRVLLQDVLRLDRHNDRANRLLREVRRTIQQQQRTSQVGQIRSQAQVALAGRQYEEALACADQALRLDPTDTDSIELCEQIRNAISRAKAVREALNRAETALFAGDFDEAKEAVEESLRLDATDSEARALASMINKELAERSRRSQVQGFVDQARRGIAERNFTGAIDALHRAEELDPTDSNVRELLQWAQRGKEQENRRRYLQDITDQIESALHGGDFSSACTISEMGLQRFPDDPTLTRLRAISEKQRDIAERRRFVHDQSLAVKALTEQDKLVDAVQILTDALRRYPAEPNLESLLAITRAAIDRQQIEREEAARKKAVQRAEMEARAQLTQQVLNWSIELRRALDARAALAEILKSSRELRLALEGRQIDDHARDVASLVLNELNARIRTRDQTIIELDQLQHSFERSLDVPGLNEIENRLLSAKAAFPNEERVQRICSDLTDSISRARDERNHSIALLADLAQTVETTPTSSLMSCQEQARKLAAGVANDPRVGALLQQIDAHVNRRFERRAELLRDLSALQSTLPKAQSLDELGRISDRAAGIAGLDSTDDELSERSRQLQAEAAAVRESMESLLRDMAALAGRVATAPTVDDAEGLGSEVKELAERRLDFQNLQEAATRIFAEIQGRRIEHDLIVQELESGLAAIPLLETDEDLVGASARARECLERHPNDPTVRTLSSEISVRVDMILREREELRVRRQECDHALSISRERLNDRDLDGSLDVLLQVEAQNQDRVDLHVQISFLRKAIEQRNAEQEQLERDRRAREKAEQESLARRAAIDEAVQKAHQLLTQGLNEQSLQCLRTALEREPGHEELEAALQATLAEIGRRQEEHERLERERIARESAEAEARARRQAAEEAINEARKLLEQGLSQESVERLRAALKEDQENFDLRSTLGAIEAEITRRREEQERLERERLEREQAEAGARARKAAADHAIVEAWNLLAQGQGGASLQTLHSAIEKDAASSELRAALESIEAEVERQQSERERLEQERTAREKAEAEARALREAAQLAIKEAQGFLAQGRSEESVQRLRSALESDSQNPDLRAVLDSTLGEIARRRTEQERLEQERAEAEAKARKAAANQAIERARKLFAKGNSEESLTCLHDALQRDLENAELRSEVQLIEMELQRRRAELERAERERIAREKAEAEARLRAEAVEQAVGEARHLLGSDREEEASQRLRSALEVYPKDPDLVSALDSIQHEIDLRRAEQARLERERLEQERIAREKVEAEALARRMAAERAINEARRVLAQGHEDESVQHIQSALERDPENGMLLSELQSVQEKIARLRLERERLDRERLERERIAQEKAAAEARARRETAELAIREAQELLARSRADESVQKLRGALIQDPENVELRKAFESTKAELARQRVEQERLERERVERERLERERIAREKAEAEARARREAAELAIKEARELLAGGRGDDSLRRLRAALDLDPQSSELRKAFESTKAELARQRAEQERLERERVERERLERERVAREKAEAEARARREAAELAIQEARELLAGGRGDDSSRRLRTALDLDPQSSELRKAFESTKAELARQRAEQERLERERVERERLERERIAREKAEAEARARREAAELAIKEAQRLHSQGRLEESVQHLASAVEKDLANLQLKASLQAMQAEVARQRAEKERLEKEKRERERIAREKAEAEERARQAEIEQAIQKARKLLAKGLAAESLECLRSALTRNPESKELKSALESTQAEIDRRRQERERQERERLAKEEAARFARNHEIELVLENANKLQEHGKHEEALRNLRAALKSYADSQPLRTAIDALQAKISEQRAEKQRSETAAKMKEPTPAKKAPDVKPAPPESEPGASIFANPRARMILLAAAVLAIVAITFGVWRTIGASTIRVGFTLDPPDAFLKIDGIPMACASPCTLTLSSKEHQVVAEKLGYSSASVVVGAQSGGPFSLHLTRSVVSTASASLSFVSDGPISAFVSLDGKQQGNLSTQSLRLPGIGPGSHKVEIPESNGTLELSVEVSPEGIPQITEVHGLDQIPVVAMFQNGEQKDILCRCTRAEIRIDGKKMKSVGRDRFAVSGRDVKAGDVTLLRDGQSQLVGSLGADPHDGTIFVGSSEHATEDSPEVVAWKSVESSHDIGAFQKFLAQFPGGQFAKNAKEKSADLAWASIHNSTQVSALRAFISSYPESQHAAEAQTILRKAEEDAKRQTDADEKRRADAETKQKGDQAAKVRADQEAKLRADAEAKQKADQEAKARADQEAKLRADAETKQRAAEEETRKHAEDDRQGVFRALDIYTAAYSRRDLKALADIWPNFPPSYKKYFGSIDKISVTLTRQHDPQINGDTAMVLCNQKLEIVASGKTSVVEQSRQFTLRRVQDRWVIEKDN